MIYNKQFHSWRTSIGTKRGIAPYWAKYRRGKKIASECPFHKICLELAFNSKRELYVRGCPYCRGREGYPRAHTRFLYRSIPWERVKEQHYKLDDESYCWIVEADEKFQREKRKILAVSNESPLAGGSENRKEG